jgi:uncharacterized protein YjiK
MRYAFGLLALSLLLLTARCSDDKNKGQNPVATYDLNLPEPSDLCFGLTTDTLYTVSDNSAQVYEINTKGELLSVLPYVGNDLEGICCVNNKFLYVAEEGLRKITKLDLQGNVIDQKTIPVEQNDEDNGLEGIAYASFNSHFYILNEKDPGLLMETDTNFNVLNNYPLSFADDYSGICVDNGNKNLWILSDESQTVNKCTMKGEIIESIEIKAKNPEGIAFNPDTKKIYIVSDDKAQLYVFDYIVKTTTNNTVSGVMDSR